MVHLQGSLWLLVDRLLAVLALKRYANTVLSIFQFHDRGGLALPLRLGE